ncbi:MAG: extracellular solute-binding protein, partial [Mycobacteriales bacterium]
MRSVRTSSGGAIAAAVALLLMAGCNDKKDDAKSSSSAPVAPSSASSSSSAPSSAAPDKSSSTAPSAEPSSTAPAEPVQENVKLSVFSTRPDAGDDAKKAFAERVKAFEAKNPNIKLDPREFAWDAATFPALLAGKQVPTVFQVPFTDGRILIARKQVSDITAAVKTLPYGDKWNKSILAAAQDESGNIFAMPTEAYANGFHYNRELFKAAGLDPEKPPTTWDEVRTYAKTIKDKTGKPGYVMMSSNNTGGWQLTTAVYSLGGRMETIDASGKATATINTPETKKILEYLKAMRFEDDSMGATFTYDWPTSNEAFGAGKFGMYTQGANVYNNLVSSFKVDPKTYGLAPLPVDTSNPDAGTLTGGTLTVVVAGASDAEKQAAVNWINYQYLGLFTNKEAAIAKAKLDNEAKQPVGTPQTPIFDQATLDESISWTKEFNNVPLDQMKPFVDALPTLKLIPEPP